ncbi:MAG: ergothioneine biosynthesis protein EgtB, partial [Parvibaculum sp.]
MPESLTRESGNMPEREPTFATRETRNQLKERYLAVRQTTETLAEQLSPEDQTIQSMTEASTAKWHRA